MSVPPPNSQPRLAGHVRACRVGDQLILLDLLRGKYIGIGGPLLPAVSAAILGRFAPDDAPTGPSNSALVGKCIQRLRDQHLLSQAPVAEPAATATLLEPTAGLTMDEEPGTVAADWRHLPRLWRATFITSRWLRRRSLADIAGRVVALKAHLPERKADGASDALTAAAASYVRLRPFALTTEDRCLNDSLALIHFLATRGLSAQWVIGVRVHPFGAHSWAQNGHVVLNDLPEHVRRYQPILVV